MSLDRLLSSLAPGGRDFERLCEWLLLNVPEYRAKVKHVWRWDKWPERWGADAGIDLVAETHDGELWAVQAKHYDPAYAIRKADVDSFLSESSRSQFSYRLLIATTDHLGATARRTIDGQEKQVGVLLRTALTALDVEWPSSLDRLRPAKPKPPKPRPHQRHAVQAVVDGLGKHDRGQMVMACGTGKTLAARFLHDTLGSRRTLVLVPSLSLVRQTLREWLSVSPLDYLAVCSDETVAAEEHDAVIASTSELGVPVTTDPDEIATFLRRRRPGVVFATYQSSPRIAEAQQGRVPAFDLALCDEAHRCTGPLAGAFTTILDPARIKARRRLFMTATPRYFTGRVKKEAKEADWEVASMDDEERFGPVLHKLSFARAIEQDLLSDYQVVVVGVTDSEAHDLAERGAFVTRDGKPITDARTLARQIGLLRAMAKHDLHRVVSFHSRIDGASRFASSLLDTNDWLPPRRRASGEIWADHVSGAMTSGEREVKLNRLRSVTGGERGLLANARCLSEGVDVPTLDGVAFIDPRRSQVDVVQAVGRAIRKAKDKTLGTIVIPVFVAHEDDPEVALASSEFDRVWEVVRALRDHDEDLADELDELRRGLGQRGTVGERPGKIVLDLPTGVTADFARAFDTRVVETATASWEFWFGLLERFAEREGHPRPAGKQVEAGFPLGAWVNTQRTSYARGSLEADRITRLESVPRWVWNERVAAWESTFRVLRSFAEREGHASPSARHRELGFALGAWVNQQRNAYRRRDLSPERVQRLAALPGWTWNAHDADWEVGFSHLLGYVAQHGHARPSSRELDGEFRVGRWVSIQRRTAATGSMRSDRVARLEALPGWSWDARDANFEDGLDALLNFVERNGHARVPSSHVEGGYPLGDWVSNRRAFFRRGKLTPERVQRLEALPGWTWHSNQDAWESGYQRLLEFVELHGHSRVPVNYTVDGFKLGGWTREQRTAFQSGRLAPDRIQRLDALPGWLWRAGDAWEIGFAHLEQYVAREGNARVPQAHRENNFQLGAWVSRQRARFAEGTIDSSQRVRLESLPDWRWDMREADWDRGFGALQRFVELTGDARVPQAHSHADGFKLGSWVTRQRGEYAKDRLATERVQRLEALPGWVWNSRDSAWEEGFLALTRYVERERDAHVPSLHREDGYRLGQWAAVQRTAYRKGQLPAHRAERLQALPGWRWDDIRLSPRRSG